MKKIQLLLVGLLLALPFNGYAQQAFIGDVNGDGERNISDVTTLISAVLYEDFSGLNIANADMNGDGTVNISDVTMMIGCLVNENWPEPEQEGDWVDLGLPSGTLWATRNVGASSPEDYGDYFAWGETTPKSYFYWNNYMWSDTEGCELYRYNGDDGKMVLDPADDAACANYPNGRTPSIDQFNELMTQCSWQWTTRNDVGGVLLTGPNGNTMFLPATGQYDCSTPIGMGSQGDYWSRNRYSGSVYCADGLYFDGGYWMCGLWNNYLRYRGLTVRAVRISQN